MANIQFYTYLTEVLTSWWYNWSARLVGREKEQESAAVASADPDIDAFIQRPL